MEPDQPEDKVRARLDELYKDPAIEAIKDSIGNLPIWIMSGGAISYFLVDYALKTGKIAPKSPRLARAGMVCLGLFGGLQAGLWKIQVEYLRLDPKKEKVTEVRSLITELSQRRADRAGECDPEPVLETSPPTNLPGEYNTHSSKPTFNKYGDVIE